MYMPKNDILGLENFFNLSLISVLEREIIYVPFAVYDVESLLGFPSVVCND